VAKSKNAAAQNSRMSTINSTFGANREDRAAYIECMAGSGYAPAQEQGVGPTVAGAHADAGQ
jgi:hypothetical protein